MKLSLGFSPCPNDTFIFDALVHNKIDTEGLEFETYISDVEDLNLKAINGELDITKLSYHAYLYVVNNYILLNSGSALGDNVGPLLICKKDKEIKDFTSVDVAIPGKYTTANLLFTLAYPEAKNKVEMLFSDIEQSLIEGKVDAGVIIHENRFTYQNKGLKKIIDLGEFWTNKTDSPIPLGGIVVKRDFPTEIQQKINRVMRRCVEFAMNNPESSKDYITKHSQDMRAEVINKHVNLYVNKYTEDLGKKGQDAIELMFDEATKIGLIPKNELSLFVE